MAFFNHLKSFTLKKNIKWNHIIVFLSKRENIELKFNMGISYHSTMFGIEFKKSIKLMQSKMSISDILQQTMA